MNQPYRILHIDTDKTWRGGQQQAASLIKHLNALGHENILVSPPESELLRRIPDKLCDKFLLSMRNELDVAAAFKLSAIIKSQKPDLIHAHSGRAHTIGLLARMLSLKSIPLIVSRRVDFPIKKGLFSRWKYKKADYYIPISKKIASRLSDYGISPDRMNVVYSGVEPDRFRNVDEGHLREEFSLDPNSIIIGNIAYCDAPKRQRDIIKAAPVVLQKIPKAQFFIVGDGPLREELIALADELGVADHSHFPGFQSNIGDYLKLFDIFLMVSEDEGLGSSILDAQYFGLPVIATPVGGIPEIVIDGETGILTPVNNHQRLADNIIDLANSSYKRQQIGELSKQKVFDSYTTKIMSQNIMQIYHDVIQISNKS